MKSVTRYIRVSPKKANLIADLVRGKEVNEALSLLKFTPKKAAELLRKAVLSAAKNAENNFKQDMDKLYIKEILVTKGPTLKRGIPVSRGRWHKINKRTSHFRVTLEAVNDE